MSLQSEVFRQLKTMASGDPSKKYTTSRANLILAHDLAKTKRFRLKIALRLFFLNLSSRHLTVANAFLVLPKISSRILEHLATTTSPREEAIVRRRLFGEALQILETEMTSDFATIAHELTTYKFEGKQIVDIVLKSSRDAIASMIVVQVVLALLQTIFELKFHDKEGRHQRKLLVKAAERRGISGVSSMNMDKLRVSLAHQLVDDVKRARRGGGGGSGSGGR